MAGVHAKLFTLWLGVWESDREKGLGSNIPNVQKSPITPQLLKAPTPPNNASDWKPRLYHMGQWRHWPNAQHPALAAPHKFWSTQYSFLIPFGICTSATGFVEVYYLIFKYLFLFQLSFCYWLLIWSYWTGNLNRKYTLYFSSFKFGKIYLFTKFIKFAKIYFMAEDGSSE
jgi:hypothetical protein